MAKKRQTTGRPRKDRPSDSDAIENATFWDKLLGNPSTRAEQEDAINRLLQRSIMIIVAIIGVIVAAGFIYELLLVPQLTIATVNGENISVNQFRERLSFEQGWVLQQAQLRSSQIQQQAAAFGIDPNQLLQQDQQFTEWSRELQFPDLLGERVVNDMIDDALVRQEFDTRGLSVGDAEIEAVRQDFFGIDMTEIALIGTPATETPIPTITATPFVSPTPTLIPTLTLTPTITASPTLDPEATTELTVEAMAEVTSEVTAEVIELPTIPPSPTPNQEERIDSFNESVDLFSESLRQSNISQAAIDDFWERQAMQEALIDEIVGTLEMTTFANVRHILVATEEEAQAVAVALNAGESFSLLANSRSIDTRSANSGGELDWQPVDLYVPAFTDAVREATLGTILDPVESDFGWHVIQVRAREEREIEGQEREQVRFAIFSRWLDAQREATEEADNITINDNWTNFLPQR
jgi:parvulin-like peptidyl-prolyl cis-trans isomerase-like protein